MSPELFFGILIGGLGICTGSLTYLLQRQKTFVTEGSS